MQVPPNQLNNRLGPSAPSARYRRLRWLDRLRGRHNMRCFDVLRQSAYWPREQLYNWQVQHLRQLLIHCGRHVPFYNELFRSVGFDPARLSDLADLRRLPVLDKDRVSAHFERLLADNVDRARLVRDFTGGTTTGTPMAFYKDRMAASWTRALVYRSCEWCGVGLNDRICTLTGWQGRELGWRGRLKRRIENRLRGSQLVFVHPQAPDAEMGRLALQVAKLRPALLYGYPSRLLALARAAHRLNVRFAGLRAVHYSSEMMFEPERQRLAQWLNCPVLGQYGSTECYVSMECPEARQHHLAVETAIIELLDEHDQPVAPGQPGRVVVTPLFATAMPFVRYDLGDVALCLPDEPCPCGRTLPVLGPILGRQSQAIRRSDGQAIYARQLGDLVTASEAVRDLCLFVGPDGLARLELILEPGRTRQGLDAPLRQKVESLLGPGYRLDLQYVKDFSRRQGHKRRFVDHLADGTTGGHA